MGAKAQLESVVTARLDEAVAARDHAAVMRFIKLHKPLGSPQVGRRVLVVGVVDEDDGGDVTNDDVQEGM